MKDIYFHLPNEGLEGLESFALVFSCTHKQGFLFLHIWSLASGKLWSVTLLWYGTNEIGPNYENSLPCCSLSHFLVVDRFGGLIIYGSALFSVFNQKKMWVKIKHQMEVLNPIYMTPNIAVFTKMTKRQKFWIFIFHCLMKRDGIDRMFSFAKRDISEWGSRYEPKNN